VRLINPLNGETMRKIFMINAIIVILCNTRFTVDSKCADPDHITGHYRGAACDTCNLKCRNDRFSFDVFFHNGKNYDFHYYV
jgi:hypothetical protein